MEPLGLVGYVEPCVFSVSRQCWCRCKIGGRFALDVPKAYKSFWINSMVPLGDEAQVEARFGLSDILQILTQDRSTVCMKHTIGSKIILDAPDGTPRRRGTCGISLLSIRRQC